MVPDHFQKEKQTVSETIKENRFSIEWPFYAITTFVESMEDFFSKNGIVNLYALGEKIVGERASQWFVGNDFEIRNQNSSHINAGHWKETILFKTCLGY